jgi:hypothetical protein
LVHPSAIGRADYVLAVLPVAMTKAQVEASPDISEHQPVSRQMEDDLYGYYGWDPGWGKSYFGPHGAPPDVAGADIQVLPDRQGKDPDLRSIFAITGYDIEASDGSIGHLENVLLEDNGWCIRDLIIDTRNWWPGNHVLVSPYSVRAIDWSKQQVSLDILVRHWNLSTSLIRPTKSDFITFTNGPDAAGNQTPA